MTSIRRSRLAILLAAAAAAVAVLMAGVALGSGGDRTDTRIAEPSAFRLTVPGLVRGDLPWPPDATWRSDDDVVTAKGARCPRSHPHRVGFSASSNWSDVDGRVTHSSRRRAICKR